MPVSTPGYFPPQRITDRIVGLNAGAGQTGNRVFLAGLEAANYTTQSDLICIGDLTFSSGTAAANNTDAGYAGSIFIGTNAGAKTNTTSGTSGTGNPSTIIGFDALAAAVHSANNTIVGGNSVPAASGSNSVNLPRNLTVIGCGNFLTDNYAVLHETVAVGAEISVNPGATSQVSTMVFVGYRAGNRGPSANSLYQQSVLIGYRCTDNAIQVQNSVVIGATSVNGAGVDVEGCVMLGSSVICGTSPTSCVSVGSSIVINGSNNVFLGFGANVYAAALNDTLLCEVNTTLSNVECLFFGNFSSGNLIIGNNQNANRDFGGTGATNVLKLLNGSRGNANPAGGGYFYIQAGALHWIGSSGTDTQLAPA